MPSVSASIKSDSGDELGTLTVGQLPGRHDRLALDGDRIEVVEEGSYVFHVEGCGSGEVQLRPAQELFSFDDVSQRRGRLQPRQHVGRINVTVQAAGTCGLVTLSVRPRKLDAETEYRWMLDDIAELATEAILSGFAPSVLALEHAAHTTPKLLYQQFAFLQARLASSGEHDLALVLNRPHTAWVERDEHRPPGTPLRGSTRNIRALTKPGPRRSAPPGLGIPSIPERVVATRSEETLDTDPNRFVAFALERWRELARRVLDLLSADARRSGPVSRGIDAAEWVLAFLDRTLSAPMFRDVGRLQAFPVGNQVLQKRAGYREILRTFLLVETGARLALEWDVDDAFAASQRNVATLYEYWAFLQLAKTAGRVCGEDLSAQTLKLTGDGMSLGFNRGKGNPLVWEAEARGRALRVELYFNREFLVSTAPDASWSRAMRPDCSIRVRPTGIGDSVSAEELSVWLHFDAKYRVEYADQQFARPGPTDGEVAAQDEAVERLARSKREDLLKMHAYRDAIRRSAGAYVLYPGHSQQTPFTEHHELLPGLGAFALRPGRYETAGSATLQRFLADVLDHVADRATQHERSRYWRTLIHRAPVATSRPDHRLPALSEPPSDARVLCGYVRSSAHRQWIEAVGLYNVRAGNRRGAVTPDGDVLQAPDLLLYGPESPTTLWSRAGAWFIQGRDELMASGYPRPRGEVYLCCPVVRRDDEPEWLNLLEFGAGRLTSTPRGAPLLVSWQELLDELQSA